MKLLFVVLPRVLALLLTIMASAQALAADKVSAEIRERIINGLRVARDDIPYGEVRTSPIAGVYEVSIPGGPMLYVSEDGKHFIAGELFGVKPGMFVRIENQQSAEERLAILAESPVSERIVFAPEGERKAYINVFTDIDCGFCRKLHQEIPALNARGIEVRYLAYPRAGLGSDAYKKLATAWCAKDQNQVMTQLKNGEKVPFAVCEDNPVAKHLGLVQRLGLTGTPALILADGTLIPGYRKADELARILGL